MTLNKEEIYRRVAEKKISVKDAIVMINGKDSIDEVNPRRVAKGSSSDNQRRICPLSEGQKPLWMIHKMAPGNYAYNLPLAFTVHGTVDIPTFRQAFEQILEIHPVLNAVIRVENHEPVMIIPEKGKLDFDRVDLGFATDSEVIELLQVEAKKGFDLENGPLMKVLFFTRKEGNPVLLIKFHHIVFDGISSQIFAKTLQASYAAAQKGEKVSLESGSATYMDFVAWQKEWLKSEAGQSARQYWMEQLAGEVPKLELHTDKPRPAIPRYRGASEKTEVDNHLAEKLRSLALRENATLFSIVLTAYVVMLYRYTQQDEILIGTPMGARSETRFENVIGYFLNMLPIRSDLSGSPSFKALLQRVQDTVADALEHGNYPHLRMIEDLKKKGTYNGATLFKAVFYFQNWLDSNLAASDGEASNTPLSLEHMEDIVQEGEFDLTLEVVEHPDKLTVLLKYDTDLFETDTIERMSRHLLRLLDDVVRNPDKGIADLTILTEAERRSIIEEWNETDFEYPKDKCMHQLFEEQSLRTPNAIAAKFLNTSLTYAQLNKKSDCLADYLRRKGVKTGDNVGIFLERSLDLIVGLLGIHKAGGCYIPLDPVYPADRLEYMFETTDLFFLVTNSRIEDKLPDYKLKKIRLDLEWNEILAAGGDSRQATTDRPTPDDLAYIIFTSGSTGKPKGIQIYHRGLTNFLWTMAECPGFTGRDEILALTTVSFDIAALELYLPLVKGGAVDILPEDVAKDGIKLAEKIESGSATVVQATPATFQMLMAAEWETRKKLKLLVGGEALSKELADEMLKRSDDVWNVFGPTETTIWSTVARVRKNERITIGRPIGNTSIYILDDRKQPVPVGVPGELYIGGDGVAKGYIKRPELNEKAFVPNPFKRNDTIYKTGDLARYLADGSIEYLGRIDFQVKIRGFRIELGEIESALLKFNELQEAVVAVREDNPGNKRLVAYLIPKDSSDPPSRRELDESLGKTLPDYMIPSSYVVLNSFPLTLNRKVNRKGLAKDDLTEIVSRHGNKNSYGLEMETPDKKEAKQETGKETQKHRRAEKETSKGGENGKRQENLLSDLLKIAADIIEIDARHINPETNIGEYGFDSVRFTSLSVGLNKVFQINVEPSIFYQHTTVEQIAEYLTENFSGPLKNRYADNSPSEDDKPEPARICVVDKTEAVVPSVQCSRFRRKPVAIIGMSGSMPCSPDLESFWENLKSGKNMVAGIPEDRYELMDYYKNLSGNKNIAGAFQGGFLENVDKFDPSFFEISPGEAELMDPQQRLFMQTVWKTIEDAGYSPSDLSGTETVVLVGVIGFDYWELMLKKGSSMEGHTFSGQTHSIIANRISFLLNLKGPSASIDTACSSSLIAVHRAAETISSGRCEMAIAGGVNLMLSPSPFQGLLESGMLSPDGKCKAFDRRADGYARGEGVGAVLMKSLEKAESDGDYVHAVIIGSAENHGGRANSLTAPNPKAQADLIVKAQKGIDPNSITYVETHGTGTKLGDPVEINGLQLAFEQLSKQVKKIGKTAKCGIGSVKTNIGHLEAAAGIAGMFKVICAMKNEILPPNLHFSDLNPYIHLNNGPFYIVDKLTPWNRLPDESGEFFPRRAGVSSFGFGGSNAHVVLEEYANQMPEPDDSDPKLVIFSAKSEERLKALVDSFVHFLEKKMDGTGSHSLSRIAYTLQTGRASLEHRLAVVANDISELLKKLTRWIAGQTDIENVFQGSIGPGRNVADLLLDGREGKEFIRVAIEEGRLYKLAALWINGAKIDWKLLYNGAVPGRIPLPTYPFAMERYWLPASPEDKAAPPVSRHSDPEGKKDEDMTDPIHPLIHENNCTLEEKRFTASFKGNEFFLKDHVVNNRMVLPGVISLEMARAAGRIAAGKPVCGIENIVWSSMARFVPEDPMKLRVRLYPEGDRANYKIDLNNRGMEYFPYTQGRLAFRQHEKPGPEPAEIDRIIERCERKMESAELYRSFKSAGFDYGDSLRCIRYLRYNSEEAVSLLTVPDGYSNNFHEYVLFPPLLEGALQTVSGYILKTEADAVEPFVPFEIGELEILKPLTTTCYVHVGKPRTKRPAGLDRYNLSILDEKGRTLARINNYMVKPLRSEGISLHKAGETSPLYFQKTWKPSGEWNGSKSFALPKENFAGGILVFDTSEKFMENLRTRSFEGKAILVKPGLWFRRVDESVWEIAPDNEKDYMRLFEDLEQRRIKPVLVAHRWLWGHSENFREEPHISLERGVYSLFHLARAVEKFNRKHDVSLIFMYSSKKNANRPFCDAAGGFLTTLENEMPRIRCKSLNIVNGSESDSADMMLNEFLFENDSGEIRYEDDRRWTCQMNEFKSEESFGDGPGLRDDGVYLITGGTGRIGMAFAEHIASTVGAKLILVGRSGASSEIERKLNRLEKKGSEAIYISSDVTDEKDVKLLIAKIKSRFPEIHGVIHCAGVIRDSLVKNKIKTEMERVIGARVLGAVNLDEALENENLDFFELASSISAIAANPGQADYAFSCAFLDAFADYREKLREKDLKSGKTLAIGWPLWKESAMRLDASSHEYFSDTIGIKPLSTKAGLNTFIRGLGFNGSSFLVVEGDHDKIRSRISNKDGARRDRSLKVAVPVESEGDGEESGSEENLGFPDAESLTINIRSRLKKMSADILKADEDLVDPEKSMAEMGFDSINLTRLANAINENWGLDLTPAFFYEIDPQTINVLGDHLLQTNRKNFTTYYSRKRTPLETTYKVDNEKPSNQEKSAIGPTEKISSEPASISGQVSMDAPIAVIGMSGVMPRSQNLSEFWDNLKNGMDLVTEIPEDRWDWKAYDGDPLKEKNKTYSKWGGFMTEIDKFDARFFRIPPKEAERMDPQQRLFLETVWKTIEDAGYRASDLSGRKIGLYVGISNSDYRDVLEDLDIDFYSMFGTAHPLVVNRISYLFNFKGPSQAIDTLCSSSLVAIKRAVDDIRLGSCEMAIAGGVNVIASPKLYFSFSKAEMLSKDGRCKTFDKDADGFSRGEGVGAIMLKRLDKAIADGDQIHGVIRGAAENHCGRSSSLTAPNPSAQADVIVDAMEKCGIDPSAVGYIETHGTGTILGDPVEINGLKSAFKQLYEKWNLPIPDTSYCGLGSVKSNIGHLESAAGIASVLKVLLSMKHKILPGTIHFKELNPHVRLDKSPFYVVDRTATWKNPRGKDGNNIPRACGVSSFGAGGANAHVVLEEYQMPEALRNYSSETPPGLFLFSARDENRLRDLIENFIRFLEKEKPGDHLFFDIAFTLQTGREEMEERLAVVADDLDDLKKELKLFVSGNGRSDRMFRGRIKVRESSSSGSTGKDYTDGEVDIWLKEKNLKALGRIWVSGAAVIFSKLPHNRHRRRVSLPTYPFARDRYWPVEAGKAASEAGVERQTSHRVERETETNPFAPSPNKRLDDPDENLRALGDREPTLADKLTQKVANEMIEVLKIGESDISPEADLGEYGFDSISLTEFSKRLSMELKLELTPALFFELESFSVSGLIRFLQKTHESHLLKLFKMNGGVVVSECETPPGPALEIENESRVPIENDEKDIEKRLSKEILEIASKIVEVEKNDMAPEEDMSEYGFDSVSLVEFSKRLSTRFDLEIMPAHFFELTSFSVKGLAKYLYETHRTRLLEYYRKNSNGKRPVAEAKSVFIAAETSKDFHARKEPTAKEDLNMEKIPVAIVGMSVVMPNSENSDVFWENLEAGADLVSEIPKNRWDWRDFWTDQRQEGNFSYSKWSGFIRDADKFDSAFFRISPSEAEKMDPQQRIMLETVWKTIEDAGYRASELSGTKTGLFIGVSASDYSYLLLASGMDVSAFSPSGMSTAVLANRISYFLNLHGPSEPIDTACSSSLVAIHRAVEEIQNGNCEAAIAGGVNVIVSPTLHIAFSQAGLLSADGRCKTFDKNADGFARGEGAGAFFLKPLNRAIEDRDHIYAIIRGTAENHGGRSNSLTSPNGNAQAALLKKAFERANISPSTLTYIDVHGTGTPLGDAVELNALKKAFKDFAGQGDNSSENEAYCGLGSVKTNTGHLETAAGVAGVAKVLLSMKNKILPPSLHFEELNEYIDLKESPFYIVDKKRPWKKLEKKSGECIPRRAGVNATGFGGSNAFVILEEYDSPAPDPVVEMQGNHLIPLSAKGEDQLKAYARKLHDFINARRGDRPSLTEIARTLQTGREPMDSRLAVIVSSKQDCIEKLALFCGGEKNDESIFLGNAGEKTDNAGTLIQGKEGEEFVKTVLKERNLKKLARLWVSGVEVQWEALYSPPLPKRISLPAYPFIGKRYWIPGELGGAALFKKSRGTEKPSGSLDANTNPAPVYVSEDSLPESDLAGFIRRAVASILKLDETEIDVETDLSVYGFSSLAYFRLSNSLHNRYRQIKSLSKLSRHTTIKNLTRYVLEKIVSDEEKHIEKSLSRTDAQDTSKKPFKPKSFLHLETGNILLTGPTGVLGGSLLKELIENTASRIYCLVRADDKDSAWLRIRNILEVYDPEGKSASSLERRVVPVVGDISKKNLGLTPDVYEKLTRSTDMTIHNASKVSLHGMYDALEKVNIDGTRNMIRFALKTMQKYFVYVSSYTVVGDLIYKGKPVLFTEKDLNLGQGFDKLAYAKTKFESEKLVRSSDELKWIIVRPGNIMGDHKHGYYPLGKTTIPGLYYDILKTCIEMKTAPRIQETFDITPVDYIGRSIVYLATSLKQICATYHLFNPDRKTFSEIIDILGKIGFSIETIDPEEYFRLITSMDNAYNSPATEMFKFRHLHFPYLSGENDFFPDCSHTKRILEEAGIQAPAIDENLIKTYISYSVNDNYINPPKGFDKNKLNLKEVRMNENDKSVNLISHAVDPVELSHRVLENKKRIKDSGDLSDKFTVRRMHAILDRMTEFELGRFMIRNRGLDGYWSDYIVTHSKNRRTSDVNGDGEPLHDLEKKILDEFPGMLATQERFQHFLQQNQQMVKDGAALLSIPCGYMRDLLELDYSGIQEARLVGVDLDPDSLENTSRLAKKKGLEKWLTLIKQDAWAFSAQNEFDLISSSGLTLYEPDDEKVTDLYSRFYTALRPGGMLVTSYFTPPPVDGGETEWALPKMDMDALMFSKVVTMDICDMHFNRFRTTKQTKSQLKNAGFEKMEFIYDRGRMFPTVVAYK